MTGSPTYLAGTSFWIAMMEASDAHHERAVAWQRKIAANRGLIVTTEAVLWEVLNYFCAPPARSRAARLYRACFGRSDITVERFNAGLIDLALELYEDRSDKSWSIVDCLSFVAMRRQGIIEALTSDHHFAQAGFTALLLSNPTA